MEALGLDACLLKEAASSEHCCEFITDYGQLSRFRTRMLPTPDDTPRCVACGGLESEHSLK